MSADRGLSDVLAFIFTFSIIILSVSAVSVVGVDQLTEVRDREQVNSAERGMVALATTFDDLSRQDDAFRATELSLQDGRLQMDQSSLWIDVRSNHSGETWQTAENGPRTIQVQSLQHRLDNPHGNVTIAYEAGGVFRSDGATATYRPPIRCAPEQGTAVVTITELTGATSVGAGSPGFGVGPEDIPQGAPVEDSEQSVRVAGQVTGSELRYISTDPVANNTVYLNVSGMAHRGLWNRTLDSSDWDPVSHTEVGWLSSAAEDDYVYQCQAESGETLDRVVVRVVTIAVEADP
jgi:hypothetical protein